MPWLENLPIRTLLAFVIVVMTGSIAWGIHPVIKSLFDRVLPRYSHWGATGFQILIILGGFTLAAIGTGIAALTMGTIPIITFALGLFLGGARGHLAHLTMWQRRRSNAFQDHALQDNSIAGQAVETTSSNMMIEEIKSASDRQLAQNDATVNHVIVGNATEPPTKIAPMASQTDNEDRETATIEQTTAEFTKERAEHNSSWRNPILNRTAAPLIKRTPLGKRTIKSLS